MSEIADRYDRAADRFGETVRGVQGEGWDAPAPCEGWVARDVVRHLVEWMPSLFFPGEELGAPPVDDDPAAAWAVVDARIRKALHDPEESAKEIHAGPAGATRLDAAIGSFGLGDVVIHTWDLARATGQPEALDPDEVHGMYEGMQPMDEVLRSSGMFGPKVEVADDADEQTKLLAFTGRRP